MKIILRKIRTLVTHPGFRANPIAVLGRCAALLGRVALGRPFVFSLTPAGERLRVDANLRYTTVTTFVMRDHLEPELHYLAHLLAPGDTFIDIGANVGVYSLRAATLVGAAGRVIAVEPGRDALTALRANLALNPGRTITVVAAALSDHIGTATLYHVGNGYDPQAFSLLSDETAKDAETVPLTTLDAVCADLAIDRLDCLKMDAEGVEPMVLAGGRATLERFHPAVILEMNTAILERRGSPTDQAWTFLAGLGYGFHRILGGRPVRLTAPPDDFCNVIATHPANEKIG
ncbi:Methyltransferase FkbM [Rhodospirillum rubrum ATCC 11170]|uniref:Methyltransferase FkbM n=1 Tax=Rhodospirillum rubrum (strain ATCC 11170 / ATH 1.1.1 / DSM 467 / LMG 4362 / NCIMB 8255 / S1) TaxID=269796 RepID=Q2RMY2_RHORT|nr:Methyltransferase FkbM [Rhodospirillum rubrum ATCC 11170]MBK5956239.1 methyltransferase FkbM [Rhodospirillum rubrum]HAP99728.1 FkbM family methyltransferase [Rhodospirillum rubrum]HCF17471.1 FkbM family methyltransferase [Rhodospirillum rubrum]